MTRQRALIFDIVTASTQHLCADDIYLLARQQMPNIALGTVYRNLNLLVQDGLLTKVGVQGGADRYDRLVTQHDHLVCSSCGAVCDAPTTQVTNFLQKNLDVAIEGYDLNIYYRCAKCKDNK